MARARLGIAAMWECARVRSPRSEDWKAPPRARAIDVRGMVIAPGFIDMMGQTAAPFLKDPRAAVNLLTQGITTINCGEGASDAPLNDAEGQISRLAQYARVLCGAGARKAADEHGADRGAHAGARAHRRAWRTSKPPRRRWSK